MEYINIYTWIMSSIYIHATHAAAQQQSAGSLLQINVPTIDALLWIIVMLHVRTLKSIDFGI